MFVIEDYNEMLFVETVLKKIGFDCLGVQNDMGIGDKVLSFSPAMILVDGYGRKINGLQLSQKLNRPKGEPKIVLIMTPPETVSDQLLAKHKISGLINRPIHPVQLIEELARVLELDIKVLRAKLDRLGLFQDGLKEKLQIVKERNKKGAEEAAPVDNKLNIEDRIKSYQKHLDELPPPEVDGVAHNKVVDQVRDFRARENDPELRQIDEERSEFVKALFKR